MQQLISIMLDVIAPVFLVIGISWFIGKRFKPDTSALSVFLIYVFIPALVFEGIAETPLDMAILGQLGVVVVGTMVGMILIASIAIRLGIFGKPDRKMQSGIILSVLLMNAANYGIPVNTFAFGEEGGHLAIIYYAMSVIVGNILGVYFASRGQSNLFGAVKNVLTVPITYAAILGLLANFGHLQLPIVMTRGIGIMANGTIPVMLALLGVALSQITIKGKIRPILIASFGKLLIAPLIAVPLALLMGMSGIPFNVAIIQSATPTAVLASALAAQFGSDTEFVAATTLVSTLLSILTVSGLLLLLGGVG
jgi:predicted permease